MKVLVFGAGVLGSLYAAKLRQAGHEVAILARGQRAADLRNCGIVLEKATTSVQTTTTVEVIERLAPEDAYDLVMVLVRNDQIASVLPIVGANHGVTTVLFMVNGALGLNEWADSVGPERALFGLAGAGGTRGGHVVRYHMLPAWQQPTTLGEANGHRTPRLEQITAALNQAGFPVAISTNIGAWLKTHVIWTCAAAHALYYVGGSNYDLAHTRDALVLWVRAVREGYRALRALSVPITPPGLRVFEVMPEPILVVILGRLLETQPAELVIARHANAARAEYVQLGDEFLALAGMAGVATPALDRLRPYVHAAPRPIPSATSSLPL